MQQALPQGSGNHVEIRNAGNRCQAHFVIGRHHELDRAFYVLALAGIKIFTQKTVRLNTRQYRSRVREAAHPAGLPPQRSIHPEQKTGTA